MAWCPVKHGDNITFYLTRTLAHAAANSQLRVAEEMLM